MPLVKVWTWLCNYSKCEYVATPLWGKCEDETHTPKNGNLESSGTPATSELESRGKKSWPWSVLYIVGKVLKCKCRKWFRMGHLDICSTNSSWKKRPGVKLAVWLSTTKSRESTRPRCVQMECDTSLESSQGELQVCFRPRSKPGQFRDSTLGVPGKRAIWV